MHLTTQLRGASVSYQRRYDPSPPTGIDAILSARRAPRRMVFQDGAWYFDTRERVSIGPYESRTAALVASDRLTELIRHANPVRARAVIKDFIRAKQFSVPMPR
jgi:Domain of unknown function (DUF6316)